MGILLAFLSACMYAASIIIGKVSVNKTKSPLAVGTIFQLISGIVSLVFFTFDAPAVIHSTFWSWTLLVLACIFWALFTIYNFKANKLLEISMSNIIGQMGTFFVFIASAILFRENVTWMHALGILLLLSGNIILIRGAWKKKNLDKKGLLFRIIAALSASVATLLDAANSANFSVSLYCFIEYFVAGLMMWGMAKVSWQEMKLELKDNWKLQAIMCTVSAVGYYLMIKAYPLADKTVIIPINNLYSIMVVLMGILLLKESNHIERKIIAAILAFGGAVLLSI